VVAELAGWPRGVFRRPFRRVLSERIKVVGGASVEGGGEGVEVVGGASVEGGGGARRVAARGLSETFYGGC
jgi:hypothetical protein